MHYHDGLVPPAANREEHPRKRVDPMRRCILALAAVVAMGLFLPSLRAVAGEYGIQVSFAPDPVLTDVGQTFDVQLTVAAPSDSFNAFDAIITYDDSLLTLIKLSPVSLQLGSLMTSACSNHFHLFNDTGGTVTITDGLLCAGKKVAAPGIIYNLRFQVNATSAAFTTLHIERVRFADEGYYVEPVSWHDCPVYIGNITAVPDAGPSGALLRAPVPNPFRGSVRLAYHLDRESPVRLEVFDVAGRRVRALVLDTVAAGDHVAVWDGASETGAPVPTGLYFARIATDREQAVQRLLHFR